jgi:WD40 repeat protein
MGALPVRSVAWHPDGSIIVAGTADGRIFVVSADSLDTLLVRRDRAVAVLSLAFSPCGRYLASGSRDAVLDVYELIVTAGTELTRCGVARGHAAPVVAMDWSSDSALLQSNGSDGSLCFWEMPTCTRCAAAADARNADWATHTCSVSWATQGMLPCPGVAAAVPAACDRSHARTCVAVGDARGVLVEAAP